MRQITTIITLAILFLSAGPLSAQTLEWVKQQGGGRAEGQKVVADKQGNVYVLGAFSGIVDVDSGPATLTLNSANQNNAYLCKLDSSGALLWAKDLGLVTGTDITLDKYGNAVVVGSFTGTLGPLSYTVAGSPLSFNYILKLDPLGGVVWTRSFASGYEGFCSSVLVDAHQQVWVGGSFRGIIDLDPGPGSYTLSAGYGQSSAGQYPDRASYLSTLDSTGTFLFANLAPGEGMVLDSVDQTLSFSNYTNEGLYPTSSSFGGYVYLSTIQRRDVNGAMLWTKNLSASNLKPYSGAPALKTNWLKTLSIAGSPDHSTYAVGYFQGRAFFPNGTGSYSLSSPNPTISSIFILRLDANGYLSQLQQIDHSLAGYTWGAKVTTDAAGSVYISGSFSGAVDFAPNISQTAFLNSANGSGFLLKLDPYGEFEWVKQIGENSPCVLNDMTLDDFGNIYSCGSFTSTVDFDPAGVFNISALGPQDAFVHKLSGPLITGIREQGMDLSVSVYPNPCAAQAFVQLNAPLEKGYCRVLDLSGRTIMEQKNISGSVLQLDLAAQPAGLYLIELGDAKTTARAKVVKQ